MNEYEKLINIVNNNLEVNNYPKITFELYDNLFEDIYNLKIEKLLAINSDSYFLSEVYFKVLNRPIDTDPFNSLLSELQKNKKSRKLIIKNIFNSNERKIKKTNIIFNDGDKV